MVPSWTLDQVPLDTGQFTSVDSEVDEMQRRRQRAVHVTLDSPGGFEIGDDPIEGGGGGGAFSLPYEPNPFRIVVQLQILGGRENFLRSDLMTAMAQTTLCLVLGHIDVDSPFVHDPATGTVTLLANCAYQNVAAMWCDPMQWAAVTAAMRSHMLRLAFARRIGPKVSTVAEALAVVGDKE